MWTLLVIPFLYSPLITLSLSDISLFKVVPSIVTWSTEGVFDPGDFDHFIYAIFHRSISLISWNNLSFLKFGSFLFPCHSVSSLRTTLVSFQDGVEIGDLVEYNRGDSPIFSPLPESVLRGLCPIDVAALLVNVI